MYRTGQIYKIQLKEKGITYTGKILEEDNRQILILTKHPFNEEIIISKDEIRQAKKLDDMTGDFREQNK